MRLDHELHPDEFIVAVLNFSQVCGGSQLQPSCSTFAAAVFAITCFVACTLTILYKATFGRLVPPLLKISGILFCLAIVIGLLPPLLLAFFTGQDGKLAIAIVFMDLSELVQEE